jgi:hypothetical protein
MSLAEFLHASRFVPAKKTRRVVLRLTAVSFAGAMSLFASDKPAAVSTRDASGGCVQETVANYYYHPEVRLRKLHLVRPDLIPYPLAYDVYC